MKDRFKEKVCRALGASDLREVSMIQSLWSGYGKIARYEVLNGGVDTVVVKLVRLPNEADHPRGWNTDLSHERKVRSYDVETCWYGRYAEQAGDVARLPKCFATDSEGAEVMIALEDLDAAGFLERRTAADLGDMRLCLEWLAAFHASFLGQEPEGLWENGTYWHLDTRPEELEVLDDLPLKAAASEIDRILKECRWKSFVHGDAKLANFCFRGDGKGVAAVDFQYVGGGCGMKDVAYFIGSCLNDTDCERLEDTLLDLYFSALRRALDACGKGDCFSEVELEWRAMYPIAWTDFHRFLKGWSPGHWKVHSYSERLAREVVSGLRG
ncbi:phosphotransferase [Pelagicoccus mobilis]|uniref:Phosphotransferase n=1 Tax=Pelagicoccus mobilis TaxID=415221 RepID=A0A934VQJ3_9BACT|nr:phosphotransferase [Pelagicoccus mobilis]MBK1876559.1 phosphotransferase [Pelagicoccus mobilis]